MESIAKGEVKLLGKELRAITSFLNTREDFTPRGHTLLTWAVGQGNAAAARMLLYANAQVDVRDGKGVTPLEIAMINGHQDIIAMLQDSGANLPNGRMEECVAEGAAIQLHEARETARIAKADKEAAAAALAEAERVTREALAAQAKADDFALAAPGEAEEAVAKATKAREEATATAAKLKEQVLASKDADMLAKETMEQKLGTAEVAKSATSAHDAKKKVLDDKEAAHKKASEGTSQKRIEKAEKEMKEAKAAEETVGAERAIADANAAAAAEVADDAAQKAQSAKKAVEAITKRLEKEEGTADELEAAAEKAQASAVKAPTEAGAAAATTLAAQNAEAKARARLAANTARAAECEADAEALARAAGKAVNTAKTAGGFPDLSGDAIDAPRLTIKARAEEQAAAAAELQAATSGFLKRAEQTKAATELQAASVQFLKRIEAAAAAAPAATD